MRAPARGDHPSAAGAGQADAAGPADGDLADLADLLVSAARKVSHRVVEDPGVIALTPLEGMVMRHIDRHPGISPSQIAADVGLKSSNASAALRSLEAKGFITRSACSRDRRTVEVHATPAADANLAVVRQAWARVLRPHVTEPSALPGVVAFLAALDEALSA